MRWKEWLLLGLGYIAWNIVSEAYSKKTGARYKRELLENENTIKYVVNNFLSTQKNFIEDIKDEITSEKNIKIYEKYKDQVLDLFEDYRKKSEDLMKELKENGSEYLSEAKDKLKDIYEENKAKIEKMTGIGEKKIAELKDKLLKNFEKNTKELKKIKKTAKRTGK